MLILYEFSHKYYPSKAKMLAKLIRRGIPIIIALEIKWMN